MPDWTRSIATHVSTVPPLPRSRVSSSAWRGRALDALIHQCLLTVHRQPDDDRAVEALGNLFFSRARLHMLPACHRKSLHVLMWRLRVYLDFGVGAMDWRRLAVSVEALLNVGAAMLSKPTG